MSRRKSTAKAKLKATSQQERIHLWKQYFENLLGNPLKVTHEPITRIISKQLDIKLGQFTQEELDSVLRKILNRKTAGLDEIPPEVWKTRQFDDILLRHCNAVYNQNPIDRWMRGCILPFPKKGDLGLAKNYRGIIPYIHSGQDIQCSTLQPHGTQNWEHTLKKTNFDYLSNSWRCTCKKPRGNNIICWLYQDLWLHSQRKDGAKSTRLRPTKKNHYSHNDAIKKHKSKSPFSRWRHRLLQHCSRCTARRHISPIPLYNLSRLRA